MVSQRIEDALEVLAIMRDLQRHGSTKDATGLRLDATRGVASRGVDESTVRAHLIGKNVPNTLPTQRFDELAASWLQVGSSSLRDWYILDCNHEEAARVRSFFSTDAGSTPKAADATKPPDRVLTDIYRILRDTALARRIKEEQEFICQLCKATLSIVGRLYAEAHHVKPLGRPHDGPDVRENIVCVCPLCHVKLDYGGIPLSYNDLPTVSKEYVDYHNEQIALGGAV